MTTQLISGKDPDGSKTLETIAKASNFNQWMYLEIKSFLKGEILEIGSGIGNISQYVIADDFNITLSDYNTEYYEWLKGKFKHYKHVRDVLQINLLHPDFKKTYAFLEGKFDTVFLLNVIEHIEDDSAAVQNCKFLLKKNGHFILLAPSYEWLYCRFDHVLGHYRRYTRSAMQKLLKNNGYMIKSTSYFNAAGIAGWLLWGKIMNQKTIGNSEMLTFNRFVPLARILDKILGKKIGLSVIAKSIKST